MTGTGRRRAARGAALLLAAASAAWAAPLAQRIEKLIESSPAAKSAFWGIQIVDLASGKTVYQLNSDRAFVPASNVKLFTTALALVRLGPDFTFQTRITAGSLPDAEGRIRGSIRLEGGGDPNLSARAIPYRTGPSTGDPLAAIEDLAVQVAARGVKSVDGDVIGDDTWHVWQPYPQGWAVDDPLFEFGAPVSALSLNDNAFTLNVRPGARPGDPAAVTLVPALEPYAIDNRVRTVAAGGEREIHLDRSPGGGQLRLWGTIPLRDRGYEELLAVEDPAGYAARALLGALEDRGITVKGGVTVRHRYPAEVANLKQAEQPPPLAGVELARRTSAPLLEALRVIDKVSQNLHAELALRAVGRARRNIGSLEAGLEELKAFMGEIGVEQDAYDFEDASGLSRLNLVTPAAAVKLLRYMDSLPARKAWLALLPVAGQDGTLSSRFGSDAAAGRIRAKTGTLSHVGALSGYAEKPDGERFAFSVMVNNYTGPTAEVRGVMDRICTLIVE